MKIKDAFSEVIMGFNITNSTTNNHFAKYYNTLQKDSIQYTSIIPERLIEKKYSCEIKNKYFLHSQDIVIFVKNPYRVGVFVNYGDSDIVIPNNFIILRGLNANLYDYIFVANYLEKIGLQKFVEENQITGNLSIEYLKLLELPDIPKSNQQKISPLLKAINNRSTLYSKILANDEKIVLYALNSVVGDSND